MTHRNSAWLPPFYRFQVGAASSALKFALIPPCSFSFLLSRRRVVPATPATQHRIGPATISLTLRAKLSGMIDMDLAVLR
jgi:hypothetical protein